MPDKIFAKVKIKFSLNGQIRETESVISKDRINKVMKIGKYSKSCDICEDFENPRFATLNFMDKPVKVEVNEEHTARGKYYNFMFKDLSIQQKRAIQQHISLLGFPPSWKRKYFRLEANAETFASEVPLFAFESEHFSAVDLSVVDFTLNGLLLEGKIKGNQERPFNLGSRIKLSLITTENNVLEGFGGVVVRTVERYSHEHECKIQLAGIKILNVGPQTLRKYKALIKECCIEIKNKNDEKAAA